MKLVLRRRSRGDDGSLPVRGAWVEIGCIVLMYGLIWSLPVRGAWVEIKAARKRGIEYESRSPCGERGLK